MGRGGPAGAAGLPASCWKGSGRQIQVRMTMPGMKISLDAAMRARDVSRPTTADEADAERIPSELTTRPGQPAKSAEDRDARPDKPRGLPRPARPDGSPGRPSRPAAVGADGQADPDADRQARRRANRPARTAVRHRSRKAQRPAGPPDQELAREARAETVPPDDATAGWPPGRPGPKAGRPGRPRRRRRSGLGLLAGHGEKAAGRLPESGERDARTTGSGPPGRRDQADPGSGGSSPVRS
jgi:hypothetical protein